MELSELLFLGSAEQTRGRHLTLGSLQVAGDAGVFGPVQHGADLLAQLQGGGSDQAGRLPPDPDEHVGPAVQDVNALGVQQGLQLWRGEVGATGREKGRKHDRKWADVCFSGGAAAQRTSLSSGSVSSLTLRSLCSTDSL